MFALNQIVPERYFHPVFIRHVLSAPAAVFDAAVFFHVLSVSHLITSDLFIIMFDN